MKRSNLDYLIEVVNSEIKANMSREEVRKILQAYSHNSSLIDQALASIFDGRNEDGWVREDSS